MDVAVNYEDKGTESHVNVALSSNHDGSKKHHHHKHLFHIPACFDEKTIYTINISFNFVVFLVELIVGHVYNSISLISDSFHMLSDIISMAVGLYALNKSRINRESKSEESKTHSYGFERYQILGSFVNGLLLASFSFSITVDALLRFYEPEPIKNPNGVLIAGCVGLAVNMVSMLFFHGLVHDHKHEISEDCCDEMQRHPVSPDAIVGEHAADESNDNSNTEGLWLTKHAARSKKFKSARWLNNFGVYLHIVGDLIGSVLVIVVALLSKYVRDHRVVYADPVLSLILALFMAIGGIRQFSHSVPVFMQKVPKIFDINDMKTEITTRFYEVLDVHDFHIWHLASMTFICSLHVKVRGRASWNNLLQRLQEYFHHRSIFSVTIQPEFVNSSFQENGHNYDSSSLSEFCSIEFKDKKNIKNTCCPHTFKSD